MDINSTLIGIIIIAICVLPIIILSINKKRKNRKNRQLLIDFAKEKGCIIHQYEVCGNYLIGLDEVKNFVFFKSENIQFVDLSEIKNCTIRNFSKRVEGKSGSYSIPDSLSLCFIPNNKNRSEECFEFFNSDNNSQLVGELQSIEKWHKIISQQLKKQSLVVI